MVNSHEDKTKHTSRRSGGSSRASTTRKSHRSSSTRKSDGAGSKGGGSRSPTRSGEPRRSKRSKEDLEAKEKARAERDTSNIASELAAVDHTDGAVLIEPVEDGRSSRNKPRKSNRRSQQEPGIGKDAKEKVKDLLDRSNEANSGPAPGAHADSRGDEVAKDQKSGKGRFSRPLGTQSVFTMEERARMEAEKGQDQDGLVMANAVDESQDEGLAMALLNSMLDRQTGDTSDRQSKETKKARASKNKTTSDSHEESKEEQNEEASDGNKDWESSKLKKGVLVFRFLCCIIVLGAAGIGTWIALRDNSNSVSETVEPLSGGASNVTTDSGTVKPPNIPDEPISSVNPSPNETSEPSGPPNSNTGADVITFEPPSEEDCAAVANGGAIQGQDTMPIQHYLLDLDATLFLPMDLSISAGIIEDNIRVLLTPALTGCDGDVRKLRHEHHRNLANGFSYAIGNVMVDAVGVAGVSCRDASNPNCHRVSVTLDIVVKDVSVKVATVITELSQFFGGGVLATKLELAELYESIDVANLGSVDPTESPTISDQSSPSVEPSKAPSIVSSPAVLTSESPTSAPVSTPSPTSTQALEDSQSPTTLSLTPGPQVTPTSPRPTRQPTPGPTPPPTPGPTPGPTPFPTLRPVSFPTFPPDPTPKPSTSPTPVPSGIPTTAPVVPSESPSENPTPSPSKNPTTFPSSTPTSNPSSSPSARPTIVPTSGPTKAPTKAPTTNPTPPPSTSPSTPIPITPAPTQSPTITTRAGKVRAVLADHAPWNEEAFRWLTETDTWEPGTTNDGDQSNSDYLWMERYVMADLYFTTNGANWRMNDNWLSTLPVCNWFSYSFPTNECPGAIKDLSLYSNQLTSSIPSSIGSLTKLTSLALYNNRLSSSIPSSIGSLTKLRYLSLAVNQLTSSIPLSFGSLTQLEDLYLHINQLTSSIPSSIGSLTKLTSLSLSSNQLTSSIPSSIGSLTKLTVLSLSNNQLTSSIPSSIGSLTQLQYLYLLNNKLSGSIPVLPSSIMSGVCLLADNNCFQDTSNGQSAGCLVTPNCS